MGAPHYWNYQTALQKHLNVEAFLLKSQALAVHRLWGGWNAVIIANKMMEL